MVKRPSFQEQLQTNSFGEIVSTGVAARQGPHAAEGGSAQHEAGRSSQSLHCRGLGLHRGRYSEGKKYYFLFDVQSNSVKTEPHGTYTGPLRPIFFPMWSASQKELHSGLPHGHDQKCWFSKNNLLI